MVPAVMAAGSDTSEASLSEEADVRCIRSRSCSGESDDSGRGAGDSGALGRDSNGRVPEVSDEGACGGGAPRKRGGLEISGMSAAEGAVRESRSISFSLGIVMLPLGTVMLPLGTVMLPLDAMSPREASTGDCGVGVVAGAEIGVPGMFPTPRGRITGAVLAESIRDASRTASSSTDGSGSCWTSDVAGDEYRMLGARTD